MRASSPACRTTDPRGLVDGRFLRANWAGPRLEGGAPSTWWLLDLGPANALVCNYYTLRHDGSANFLRSWALQARLRDAALPMRLTAASPPSGESHLIRVMTVNAGSSTIGYCCGILPAGGCVPGNIRGTGSVRAMD